ncbi:MAG: type II secretion system protein GspD [Luteolibacter sp.]
MPPLRILAIVSLGTTSVFAQAPPLPPGIDPSPSGGAAIEAGDQAVIVRPANFDPDIPLGDNLIVEDIVQPKLNGNDLAAWYRIYTGRRVIVSAAAAQAEFAFIQDASQEDPLTYSQAADLLRKAAAIENFIFVPDGTDKNLDFLTLATGGIRPSGIGIDVYTEDDPLPEGGVVISYIMSFDHIKPENAVNAFQQVVGQFGAFGSIAPIPNTASVVITENTTLIRKLIDLKREIDKPSAQVATRFIRVQYADVTELAATLNELINAQQQTQTTAGIQRAEAAPAPAVDGGAPAAGGVEGGGQAGETTPVQIIPDPRTSRIFAMGRPVDLLFVEGLIREFDTQTDNRTFMRRKLKFLTVSEFLPIAGDALTRAFTGTGEGGAAGGGTTGTRGQSNRPGGGATSGIDSQQSNFGGQTGGRFGGQTGGGAARGNALGNPNVSSAPESLLVGRTLLVADNITNSVIVQGPPSGIEIVERLLDQLDVKADQVMISTVFGQLTLGNNIETGIDYVVRSNDIVGRGGGGLFPNLPIVGNGGGTDPFPGQLPGGPGLRIYGNVGDLSIYLRALQSVSDFTVLSRPSIFTANNQRGTISSGRRIAVPTNSNQFSGGGVSTNIEYRDVVLKLEVIPLINDENTITLQIALVSDDVIGQSEPIGELGSVPIIGTREILTTVTVPNNETVILGGLITTNDETSKSGIPILSSIPGIGRLFSTNTQNKSRDELMVFIQPSIINSDRTLDAVQADMDARYRVSQTAREFSDGPGVLPDGDSIQPVQEKGQGAIRASNPATGADTSERRSLRPIHRR